MKIPASYCSPPPPWQDLLSTATVGGSRPAQALCNVLSTATVGAKGPLASTRHVLSTATVAEHLLSTELFMLDAWMEFKTSQRFPNSPGMRKVLVAARNPE